MKKILTASQMRQYDTYTIEQIGIPAMVLMERAAYSAFEEIKTILNDTIQKPANAKVLIVCGSGNNGGDGLVLARLLISDGIKTETVMLGDVSKLSAECEKQYQILLKMGVEISTQIKESEYDIIVDAMFGIGLSRNVEGKYAESLIKLNSYTGYKVSLDIPSGLCSDTGKVLGQCFKADMTVTFGFPKRGLFINDGQIYAGKVVCKDIGIINANIEKESEKVFTLEENIQGLLPYRKPNGNKGTFGKVYIYAGSEEMIGAALLCARSAFAAGSGMVKILCPAMHQKLFAEQIPEAMLTCYEPQRDIEILKQQIIQDLDWCDSVVAGPGIGLNDISKEILHILLKYAKVPMVLDADALNLLAKYPELKAQLLLSNAQLRRKVILTPHVGEASRLLGVVVSKYKETPFDMTRKLSEAFDSIAVCKDARTIVSYKNQAMYLNTSGNHGMATAGSGDVLTGLVGAYMAISDNNYRDVITAVYLHGLAGDWAADKFGERALMASHIIEGIISLQKG